MSPDDNAKMRGKETSGRKRLKDGISCDGINKMRRRKINNFECMKEAKKYLHKKRRQRLNMTQDKLLQSNERARLQKMTARLGMS